MLSIDIIETKYCNYDLYDDDDVLIKNIILVGLRIIYLPLCLLQLSLTVSNNETVYLNGWVCEMNNKCCQSI